MQHVRETKHEKPNTWEKVFFLRRCRNHLVFILQDSVWRNYLLQCIFFLSLGLPIIPHPGSSAPPFFIPAHHHTRKWLLHLCISPSASMATRQVHAIWKWRKANKCMRRCDLKGKIGKSTDNGQVLVATCSSAAANWDAAAATNGVQRCSGSLGSAPRRRGAATCSARVSVWASCLPGGTRSPSSPRWSSRTPPSASPVARGGPPPPPPAPAPGTAADPPNSFPARVHDPVRLNAAFS